MALDTFICGECQHVFHEIDVFVAHKSNCTGVPCSSESHNVVIHEQNNEESNPSREEMQQSDEYGQVQHIQSRYLQPVEVFHQQPAYELQQEQPVTFLMPENAVLMTMDQSGQGEMMSSNEQGVVVVTQEQLQSFEQQIQGGLQGIVQVEVLQGSIKDNAVETTSQISAQPQEQEEPSCNQIELVAMNSNKYARDLKVVVRTPEEIVKEKAAQQVMHEKETSVTGKGKKRGRPKKAEEQAQNKKTPQKKKAEEHRPKLPKIGEDGRYYCVRCQKAFTRERHFKTHRCLTWSDYVNISDKDVDELSEDTDPSFSIKIKPSVEKKTIAVKKDIGNSSINNAAGSGTAELKQENDDNSGCFMVPTGMRRKGRKPKNERIITGEALEDKTDKPIFTCEKDKLAFDQAMSVDLAYIDHLFTSHMIEQEMNEKAVLGMGRSPNQLTIFTCNNCKKVFMSLSQCRLHCLSHTDIKPFKCIKCDFSTNAKGNLYTHMRHHTGQIYKCSQCPYTAGNKMHVVEHEETHLGIKHPCKLCKKQYATKKSLSNHVRGYHKDDQGKEYLATFMVRGHRGKSTVLHQCHVCNRKFKKRADRDRHLFFHDIDDIPYVFRCEICPYATNRRNYLDKHCKKHKVIYICYLCKKKFISTIRLSEHLNQEHDGLVGPDVPFEEKYSTWKDLFEKCITSSLILPEALTEGIVQVENIEDKATGEVYQHLYVETAPPDLAQDSPEGENESESQEDPLLKQEEEEGNHSESTNPTNKEDIFTRLKYKAMTTAELEHLHNVFGQEECEHCGRLFHEADDLQSHIRLHTGERPFTCTHCPYSAVTKLNLKHHIEREHELVTYKCTLCDFTGNSQAKLYKHQKLLHNQTPALCSLCNEHFQDFKVLRAHLNVKHPGLPYADVKKMIFPSSRPQLNIGRRVYKCPYCERAFLRDYPSFQRHLWIHQGIKPFKCTQCSYSCRGKNNLQSHMLRHSKDKPFKCHICQKSYKSRTALRWHVRGHTFGRQFHCEKCNYQAMQESHLKRHLETHNLIKRHQCLLCDFTSNRANYMKLHYSRLHKGHDYVLCTTDSKTMTRVPGQKVYKCLTCEYIFGNTVDLKRHLRIKHGVKDSDLQSLNELQTTSATSEQGENEVMDGTVVTDFQDVPFTVTMSSPQMHIPQQAPGVVTVQSSVPQVVSMDPKIISISPDNHQVLLQQPETYFVGNQTQIMDGNFNGDPPKEIIVQYVSEEVINSGSHTIQNLVPVSEDGNQVIQDDNTFQSLIRINEQKELSHNGNSMQGLVDINNGDNVHNVVYQDVHTADVISSPNKSVNSQAAVGHFINQDTNQPYYLKINNDKELFITTDAATDTEYSVSSESNATSDAVLTEAKMEIVMSEASNNESPMVSESFATASVTS